MTTTVIKVLTITTGVKSASAEILKSVHDNLLSLREANIFS